MRPALPAGAYQIQVKQIVEPVERRSIEDITREVVAGNFAAGEEHRHIQAFQALAQPMTSRAGQQNTNARFSFTDPPHDFRKDVRTLLPFGPVWSDRECRV